MRYLIASQEALPARLGKCVALIQTVTTNVSNLLWIMVRRNYSSYILNAPSLTCLHWPNSLYLYQFWIEVCVLAIFYTLMSYWLAAEAQLFVFMRLNYTLCRLSNTWLVFNKMRYEKRKATSTAQIFIHKREKSTLNVYIIPKGSRPGDCPMLNPMPGCASISGCDSDKGCALGKRCCLQSDCTKKCVSTDVSPSDPLIREYQNIQTITRRRVF